MEISVQIKSLIIGRWALLLDDQKNNALNLDPGLRSAPPRLRDFSGADFLGLY